MARAGGTMSGQAVERTPDPDTVQFLRLVVGEFRCAVEVGRVANIVETPQLTPVPNTPDIVAGVAQLRGELTVVLDGPEVIGADERRLGDSTRTVAFDRTDDGTALAVEIDDIDGLTTVHVDDIAPGTPPGLDVSAFVATVEDEDDTLGVLDVPEVTKRIGELV